MSAFIVSKPTMDRVVSAIIHHWPLFYGQRPLGGIDLAKLNESGLGQALYAMNLAAVLRRYPDDTKETAPGPVDTSNIHDGYQWSPTFNSDDYVQLKAIGCLLYQASEGDVPRESLLFQDLERLEKQIAHNIISEMPAYKNAPWD